jgi:hypothetical protein
VIGDWFVCTLEPRIEKQFKRKSNAEDPAASHSPQLEAGQFFACQDEVRRFLRRYVDIDLPGVRFPNPFLRGVRFSLGKGLHVIAEHEPRHLFMNPRTFAAR